MLTEKGVDAALRLCNTPVAQKLSLPTKSYETQKIAQKLIESSTAKNYDPIDEQKKVSRVTTESLLRSRAFRLTVVEVYDYTCAVCGFKIKSPDSVFWEVQAVHIVPHRFKGRDDVCNGIAMCHLHHWAFDVGWFTLSDRYEFCFSPEISRLPRGWGRCGRYELFRAFARGRRRLLLPERREIYPHNNSIRWHRENVFVS